MDLRAGPQAPTCIGPAASDATGAQVVVGAGTRTAGYGEWEWEWNGGGGGGRGDKGIRERREECGAAACGAVRHHFVVDVSMTRALGCFFLAREEKTQS